MNGRAGHARPARALAAALLLAGCASGNRVENGRFHSAKGYQLAVPSDGWRLVENSGADLELARETSPAGMLADATCDDRTLERPLPILIRHLTFGLTERRTVESDTWTVAGRPAAHRVVTGRRDGTLVSVEAVVLKGDRCVHDFLYTAPADTFDAGRGDFRGFVESFVGAAR